MKIESEISEANALEMIRTPPNVINAKTLEIGIFGSQAISL